MQAITVLALASPGCAHPRLTARVPVARRPYGVKGLPAAARADVREVSRAGECPLRSALALRAGPPARECQAGRAGGSFTAKTPLLARRKPRECLQGAADRFVPRSRLRAPIEPSRRESGQGWPKATRQGLALTAFGDEGRGESEDGAAVQIGMYLGGSEHLNPAR